MEQRGERKIERQKKGESANERERDAYRERGGNVD